MAVAIRRGDGEDVDALQTLWLQLHRHHQAVGRDTGAFVDDTTSWRRRSEGYRDWLAEPGSFLLLAEDGGHPVGYALVRVMEAGSEWTDTWAVGPRLAELETLVVDQAARGSSIGSQLLDAADAELARQGIAGVIVGIVPGNDGAQRLYERRGFRPRWIVLAR